VPLGQRPVSRASRSSRMSYSSFSSRASHSSYQQWRVPTPIEAGDVDSRCDFYGIGVTAGGRWEQGQRVWWCAVIWRLATAPPPHPLCAVFAWVVGVVGAVVARSFACAWGAVCACARAVL
jgi:hypothetical protein